MPCCVYRFGCAGVPEYTHVFYLQFANALRCELEIDIWDVDLFGNNDHLTHVAARGMEIDLRMDIDNTKVVELVFTSKGKVLRREE